MKRIKMKMIGLAAVAALAAALSGMDVREALADPQPTEAAPAVVPIQTTASITSCRIEGDNSTVRIEASSNGNMVSTDGNFYLFELNPYQDGIEGRTDPIGSVPGSQGFSYQVPLNHNTGSDRLYSSFVVAVSDGTKFVQVSEPHYITNPEAIAKNTAPFNEALTKKGLNIEISQLADAFDLGVKHVGTNIAFHQILGTGIDYEYDGKTYHFDKNLIEKYDSTISALSNKGMTVTAIVLNGWNPNTPDLIYPGTKQSSWAFYYMFNVATPEGFEQTRAIAAFLAERYDGSDPNHGKISNWIIGNEINNQQWNYMGKMDLTNYVKAYEKAFRVFYTAIRSTSANDRVYFSLDYNWNNEADGSLKYGGKQIVDSFNSIANVQGQMDWGLAYHPYPCPMTEPEFWDDNLTGLTTNDYNSPVINFKNLYLLTDYFNQEALKLPNGLVRPIILTEQGFTATSATRGAVPQIQAAAYAYSYYIVDSDPDIDAYILSRQVDAPSEVRAGLSFGLWECDMSQESHIIPTRRRKLWQVFKHIDKKDSTLENTEFAKEIIGIDKWSDVISNFKWRAQED